VQRKTTLLRALQTLGYRCVPESGRAIIQHRKAAGLSPRPSLEQFGWDLLHLDIKQYQSAPDSYMPMFFDRGIVDALSLLDQHRQISVREVGKYLARYPYNRLVFVAPPWPDIFCNDGERDQTFAESVAIYQQLSQWYERCGYTLLELPITNVTDRMAFITDHIKGCHTSIFEA
jgi:predicted ATPase